MKREEWETRIGFLLASIGSAIGLGNIWRFPYIVGISGGGIFVLIYCISVILFGLPVMLIEFATGRRLKGSVPTSFGKINSKIKPLAWILVMTAFFVLSYYLVITGWTFSYFIFSLKGSFLDFNSFLKSIFPILSFILSLFIVAFIVKRGITKGIEIASKILMPIFFGLLIFLFIYSLSLPNAVEGISFYLKPDFSKASNPRILILAFGQTLFSLSAGTGILLTYGSYLKKKENISSAVYKIAFADTLVAFLAGIIIFSIVFSFGLSPAEGSSLAFIAFPKIFGIIPFGNILGGIFFLLLFVAAITSSISSLEVVVASFVDEFKLSRRIATWLVALSLFFVGLIITLSYFGPFPLLEPMDFIFGTLFIPISAAILCIVVSWFWKPEIMIKELREKIRPGIIGALDYFKNLLKYFMLIYWIRYVIPTLLIILVILAII